jgi:hypothetical protein
MHHVYVRNVQCSTDLYCACHYRTPRQADTLLERLLLRMSVSPSVLQRRNLAFCVSELSVTEKGVKKMIELIKYVIFACLGA